jgi:hypothetical protein
MRDLYEFCVHPVDAGRTENIDAFWYNAFGDILEQKKKFTDKVVPTLCRLWMHSRLY